MIISHRQIENIMKSYQTNQVKNSKVKAENKEPTVKGTKDKVEISERASDFKVAMEALSKIPDVREDKIQGIKQRIDDGTYNIDGERIAEKIVDRVMVDKLV